jgi:hypothetical protein
MTSFLAIATLPSCSLLSPGVDIACALQFPQAAGCLGYAGSCGGNGLVPGSNSVSGVVTFFYCLLAGLFPSVGQFYTHKHKFQEILNEPIFL